jgi:hypothetical protein
MAKFKFAIVVGSNRRDSINRKLAHALVAKLVQIDNLPMYNLGVPGPTGKTLGPANRLHLPGPRLGHSVARLPNNTCARQILGDVATVVMGGEAYITSKPGLIDDATNIANERSGQLLVNQFAGLVVRVNCRETGASAA